MRYVITYLNITKEKRYHYVIVILNIDLHISLHRCQNWLQLIIPYLSSSSFTSNEQPFLLSVDLKSEKVSEFTKLLHLELDPEILPCPTNLCFVLSSNDRVVHID